MTVRLKLLIATGIIGLLVSLPSQGQELAQGQSSAEEPDMVFTQDPSIDDTVKLHEGYQTPALAAQAATGAAWARASDASTRSDGAPELEFGGVIYRAADGSYGYTSPRTNLDTSGMRDEPYRSASRAVFSGRGVASGDSCKKHGDCDVRLLTHDGEKVVGTYHIHPTFPMEGDPPEGENRSGPGAHDRETADALGTTSYVRGPDGASCHEPGAGICLFDLDQAVGDQTIRERDFVCGAYETCDDGEVELLCDGVICTSQTAKPCYSLQNISGLAETKGPACEAALLDYQNGIAERTSLRTQKQQTGSQDGGMFGGLAGLAESVEDKFAATEMSLEAARLNISTDCDLDRPICEYR